MKCGRSTSVLTAIYQFYILSTVWHEAHKICTLMIVRHCFVLRRTLYITPTQWVIVSHSPMYNFSNAKWQQQKALLSQWCKSQRTSGNVESLSMAEEEGLDAGWRGGGERAETELVGIGSQTDDAGWGSKAQEANCRGRRSREGWIESGSTTGKSVDYAVCQVSNLSAECLWSP